MSFSLVNHFVPSCGKGLLMVGERKVHRPFLPTIILKFLRIPLLYLSLKRSCKVPCKYPQQMRGQVPLFHNFHSRTGFTGLFSVRSLSTSHHTYQLLFFSSHFDQMPAEVAQLSALQSGIRGHQPSEVWGGGIGIGIGIGNSDMTIAISDCRNKCR